MLQMINAYLRDLIREWHIPDINIIDIAEVIIIALILYRVVLWIKNTKAWVLLRGLLMLTLFFIIAAALQMHAIIYLSQQLFGVIAVLAVVVFQPELRRALERLGEKSFLRNVNPFEPRSEGRFSKTTLDAILEASTTMSSEKVGALIVVERDTMLSEYADTGITLDCVVSRQVLLNIFEGNTPLHDGAVIIRGNRIVAATCYLPLTDSAYLSKELGTRHRAAIGMSEASDAFVIVISEETGKISVATRGILKQDIDRIYLAEELKRIQGATPDVKKAKISKGRKKHE